MKFQKENLNFFQEYVAATVLHKESLWENTETTYYLIVKRLFDIILAIFGLLITLPVIVVFAIAIRLETPGSSFYIQERVGLNGRYFNIIKLRSMGIDAEKNGAKWAEKNDPRVTKIGLFIRKTRIDELPQLWNVLVGDMSLVGPRPERPIFTAQFNEQIPGFVNRLKVKPGLTGWAQVNGGYDITPQKKLELDNFYIENISFILDLKIVLKTINVCITGTGAR